MKTTTILISCAFLGGAAFVQADGKGFGDGTLPEFLAPYDCDGNGVLDEEEVQAMKQLRKQAREEKRDAIDTNGDGKVSLQERERAREQMQTEIEAKRAEKFAEIDTDEDGKLSPEEFAAIPGLADVDEAKVTAMFTRLDADGDGFVTLEEFMARLRHHQRGDGPCDGDGEPAGDGPHGGNGSGPGPGDGGPGDGDGGTGPGPGGEPRDGSGDGVPDGPR